ncbi:MAG: AEC family transporter [Reyranella sp.]|uniref:AEC family transporter n=1 Tax=Reyranella sp. TaxID=1929291 RepID=UPI003D1005CB
MFLPLALIALLGVFLRQLIPSMEDNRRAMNQMVLYVFLPALVFHSIMGAPIDRLFYEIPLVAASGVFVCLAAGFLVFRFLPIPGPTKGAMILAAAFGNVTYFGLPVLLGTFIGEAAEVTEVAVLYEVTKSSLNLTIGAMIAIAHGTEEAITFRKTVLEALKLPPVWALAVAIAWKSSGIACPAFVLDTTALLATTVTGIMMLSLGMALKFKPTRLMGLAAPVAAIKLLLSPVVVALAVVPLGVTGIYRDAAILEGAMPSQLLSFIIAGRFKLDEQTMAFVIMADTVLAFVTLPFIHSLLR